MVQQSQNKKTRAAAIVVNNDKVLLMYRRRDNKEYYVFPGGSVEDGESLEQAVLRELSEETTIKAEIDRLLYFYEREGKSEYFYLVKNHSGVPKLSADSPENQINSEKNYYQPMWVETNNLKNLEVYPPEIKDLFIKDNYKSLFTD